jgi:hypothetical protein
MLFLHSQQYFMILRVKFSGREYLSFPLLILLERQYTNMEFKLLKSSALLKNIS